MSLQASAVVQSERQPEQAAQNPAQSAEVSASTAREPAHATNENRPALPSDSDAFRYLHVQK